MSSSELSFFRMYNHVVCEQTDSYNVVMVFSSNFSKFLPFLHGIFMYLIGVFTDFFQLQGMFSLLHNIKL